MLLWTSFLQSVESAKITKNVVEGKSSIWTASATMYIDENIDYIFDLILDYPNYKQQIDSVDEIEVYYRSSNAIKFKITTNAFYFIKIENYFIHKIDRPNYSIAWKLDKEKESTVSKSAGDWKLKRLSDSRTKVNYTHVLKVPEFIPTILGNYLAEKALDETILWLIDSSK